jgi:hypothetical protein
MVRFQGRRPLLSKIAIIGVARVDARARRSRSPAHGGWQPQYRSRPTPRFEGMVESIEMRPIFKASYNSVSKVTARSRMGLPYLCSPPLPASSHGGQAFRTGAAFGRSRHCRDRRWSACWRSSPARHGPRSHSNGHRSSQNLSALRDSGRGIARAMSGRFAAHWLSRIAGHAGPTSMATFMLSPSPPLRLPRIGAAPKPSSPTATRM